MSKAFLFLLIITGSSSCSARAEETSRSSVRVILPAELSRSIVQNTLGVKGRDDDANVTITSKKDIDALAQVRLKKVSDALKVYSDELFGVNLSKPFQLDIKVMNFVANGDVRVTSLRFSEQPKGNGRVWVDAKLQLRHVTVNAREVWLREIGLTPKAIDPNASKRDGCKVPVGDLSRFAGEHLSARVKNAAIRESSFAAGTVPIEISARFKAEYLTDAKTHLRKLILEPETVKHNVAEIIGRNYKLLANLQVPPVFVKIDGVCYPGDTSGVTQLFNGLRNDIKILIAEGLHKELIKIALRESARALESLNIPVEKEFNYQSPPSALLSRVHPAMPADNTAVRRPIAPPQIQEVETSESLSSLKKPSILRAILWNIQETIALENIRTDRKGGLLLSLGDSLQINGNETSQVPPLNEGNFPPQSPTQLRVILNRTFFDTKVDLVSLLREEQAILLPAGIRLGTQGFQIHSADGNRLSITAPMEITLKELPGIAGIAAPIVEQFAGNTGGIYRIPFQIDLEPEVIESPTRLLRLRFTLFSDLLENEFNQRSNLSDGAKLIVKGVKKKIQEAAQKLNQHPIDVPLELLESKAPLKLDRVVFSDRGALAIDLQVLGFRDILQANRKAKLAEEEP